MAVSSTDLEELLAELTRLRTIVLGLQAQAKAEELARGAITLDGAPSPRPRLR